MVVICSSRFQTNIPLSPLTPLKENPYLHPLLSRHCAHCFCLRCQLQLLCRCHPSPVLRQLDLLGVQQEYDKERQEQMTYGLYGGVTSSYSKMGWGRGDVEEWRLWRKCERPCRQSVHHRAHLHHSHPSPRVVVFCRWPPKHVDRAGVRKHMDTEICTTETSPSEAPPTDAAHSAPKAAPTTGDFETSWSCRRRRRPILLPVCPCVDVTRTTWHSARQGPVQHFLLAAARHMMHTRQPYFRRL